MRMRNIAFMSGETSKKIYTEKGYKIRYPTFMIIFNEDLEDGYDWYISTSAHERNHAIGIKRKDKNKSVSRTDSLNYVIRRYHLY